MARYRDSVCKLCRNEGQKLFLKGSRCDTPKCAFERRPYPSGPHGQTRRKPSEYGLQLREKQKVRRQYGLLEKPFRRYYEKAVGMQGVTGTVMFQLIEFRLDNVIYRSGLVPSRAQARQLIKHGHFRVNGQKVDIPSYLVKIGDLISPKNEKSLTLIKSVSEQKTLTAAPRWLEADRDNAAIKILAKLEREDVDSTIQEALIIEFYSR